MRGSNEFWLSYHQLIEAYKAEGGTTDARSANIVDQFRRLGVPAELIRLGFDPEWLSCLHGEERPFDITFIGSFHPMHSSRATLLETLCSRFPQAKIWAPHIAHLSPGSSIRNCYQGPAWGREMYTILSHSKIALNHHGDVLPYANNGRLYEATVMGALLVTDWKENLAQMFEPGKEVVAYRSPEECGIAREELDRGGVEGRMRVVPSPQHHRHREHGCTRQGDSARREGRSQSTPVDAGEVLRPCQLLRYQPIWRRRQ